MVPNLHPLFLRGVGVYPAIEFLVVFYFSHYICIYIYMYIYIYFFFLGGGGGSVAPSLTFC